MHYFVQTLFVYTLMFFTSTYSTDEAHMIITKAIIPAAGLGTRLLPLTKALPKEMMPLLDKPALQYIIQEGVDAGIASFCIIMNDNKKNIVEKYFSPDPLLDAMLAQKNKSYLTKDIYALADKATMTFAPQPEPLGLGHAILMGRAFIKEGKYFCVMLPDDIVDSTIPCMHQLIAIAQTYNAAVIAVEEVPADKVSSYGIIAPKETLSHGVIEVAHLVEKPSAQLAPSRLGIIGRYVLPYRIFDAIEAIAPHATGEIQLTDALEYLIKNGERVIACVIQGTRYDIGSIEGLLNATVSFGRKQEPYASIINSPCQ